MNVIENNPFLTRGQVNGLVKDFVQTEFEAFENLKRVAGSVPELSSALQEEMIVQKATRRRLIRSIADDNYLPMRAHFNEFLEARGAKIDPSQPLYSEILKSLALAHLEILEKIRLGEGMAQEESLAPHPAQAPTIIEQRASPKTTQIKTIAELIEPYLLERRRGDISESFAREIRTALDWFSKWVGPDRQIAGLRPEEVREFKSGLLALPANWSKKLKGKTIREAATFNADGHLPRLEIQSLNSKRWIPVTDFLGWAKREHYSDTDPSTGLKIAVSKSHRRAKRRDQFEIEDLNKMFSAPVFCGAQSDTAWRVSGEYQIRDYRFWLPLLALFTGGRRGELCPLLVENVIERDGVLCIRIRETFDEDGEKVYSLKNVESARLVPVHPELLKIGFKEFVQERRDAGRVRLFNCPEKNKFDQFGKWFSRFLQSLEVKTTRNTFHSFRHTMEQGKFVENFRFGDTHNEIVELDGRDVTLVLDG